MKVVRSGDTEMPPVLSAQGVRDQVQLIQQVMAAVMKDGEHFGKIPGCGPKPTLLKSGAEKLAATFRLAPQYSEVAGSREEEQFISYKIRCDLVHAPTGNFVGSGLGACNSRERKYRNNSPWDIQNTLYKMACKRAFVAAILNATAASDIFTQDLEDLPRDARHPSPVNGSTQPAPQTGPSEIVTRFMAVNKEFSARYGEDGYQQFLRNSKGESPTIENITKWKTPKQLAWLRTAVEAMEERLAVAEDESPFPDASPADGGVA